MRKRANTSIRLAGLLCCTWLAASAAANVENLTAAHWLSDGLDSARVPFTANDGQIDDPRVRFYAQTFAGTIFVTVDGQLVYSLPLRDRSARWAFRESFRDAAAAQPRGALASSARVSYYKGVDPEHWIPRAAAYDSITLGELYPGIQITLRAGGNNVEKLFHVAPGADVDAIDIAVDDAGELKIDSAQRLVLATPLGDIAFTAPIAYQQIDGQRVPIEVAYVLRGERRYGFRAGAYDAQHELVIDPLLASTYLGGRNPNPPGNYDDDIIHAMLIAAGDVYVAGATQSPDFPVRLGYDETLDSAYPDGFITRLSADLSTVVASTYIGTDSFDRVEDIALDEDGAIIAVGQAGHGFPVTGGAYTWSGTTPVGGGFVARFSEDLSMLLASAVPTPSDYPRAVARGNDGIYFGGTTNNPDFPITPDAYLSTCCPAGGFGIREYDGFLGKLSADLTTLETMTYLGGDVVSAIAVATDASVYITDGLDNAITGYIARLDAGLSERTAYLSYYPGSVSGSSRTYFNDLAAGDGYVVAVGQTYMNDLPATADAFDITCGTDGQCDGVGPLLVPKSDGFIAIYSDDLQQTLALSYLGGSDHESIRAVALGADGSVHVAGETTSVDFPTTANGADQACGSDGQCDPVGAFGTPVPDGFVARLSGDLSLLHYGSYLGGADEDRSEALALDGAGLMYTAGYTRSADFPTTAGAFDRSYNGGTSDAFISRIDASTGANQPPIADAGANLTVAPLHVVTLDGSASSDPDGQIVGYQWSQLRGLPVTLFDATTAIARFRAPFVRPGTTRVLVFELEVTDEQGATATDRIRIGVTR